MFFGITKKKDVEYDLTSLANTLTGRSKAKVVKDSTATDNNVWIISPKMETPVLDFSNQPFVEKTGSYWRTRWFWKGDVVWLW